MEKPGRQEVENLWLGWISVREPKVFSNLKFKRGEKSKIKNR